MIPALGRQRQENQEFEASLGGKKSKFRVLCLGTWLTPVMSATLEAEIGWITVQCKPWQKV
jgi:hypothetical protein